MSGEKISENSSAEPWKTELGISLRRGVDGAGAEEDRHSAGTGFKLALGNEQAPRICATTPSHPKNMFFLLLFIKW